MSTLDPLPPHLQAQLEQRYHEWTDDLARFVAAARTDPKRDPDNPADYMNTVCAMLIQAEAEDDDRVYIRGLSALAFIALADTGWAPPGPKSGDPRVPSPEPAPAPRERRHTFAAWWFAAFAFAAGISVGATLWRYFG